MATFAAKDFNAEQYQAYRPSYPAQLYDTIYEYHTSGGGGWGTCIDLGCGTGQSARAVAERFDHVIGVDPSSPMIESARKTSQATRSGEQVRYEVSPAEKLGILEDESVDLITAATSSQYFTFPDVWTEIKRVLRPRGTVAFFSYTVHQLAPPLTPLNAIINEYADGPDQLGPYKNQPGYDIVHTFLDGIPSPGPPFEANSERRIKYVGEHYPARVSDVGEKNPVILKVRLTWQAVEAWFRTSGVAHNYAMANPEDAKRPDGDVVSRFMRRLRAQAVGMGYTDEMVDCEVPMALLLFRKAA